MKQITIIFEVRDYLKLKSLRSCRFPQNQLYTTFNYNLQHCPYAGNAFKIFDKCTRAQILRL